MPLRNWFATVLLSVVFGVLPIAEYPAQSQNTNQVSGTAQPTQPQRSHPTAGESKNFTNLQVLKDIPEDQLVPSMQFISGALGVECSFCHVADKGHEGFASDEKRSKATARQMMTMVNNINSSNFKGQQRVTCATCHAGHANPNPVAPVLNETSWQERVDARTRTQARVASEQASRPETATGNAGQQPHDERPSPEAMQAAAEEIVARYTQAIGGEAAIERLNSRSEKGVITTPHGDSMPYELQQKAPDKILMLRTLPGGTQLRVLYNGTEAVVTNGAHNNPVHGFELNALKLDANFFRNLKLKQQYARMQALPFTTKIGDQETRVVRGTLPDQMGQETLYFDLHSGLLLRRLTVLRTPLGGIPQQYDYSDYREISGVKVPFTVTISTAENIQTRKTGDQKFNVAISDSAFEPSGVTAPGGN